MPNELRAGLLPGLAGAIAAGWVLTAGAIEAPKQVPPPPAATPETAPPPSSKAPAATPESATATPRPPPATPADAEDEAAMKAPPPKAIGPTPQKFTPTEKVRADYPVAFPIDI